VGEEINLNDYASAGAAGQQPVQYGKEHSSRIIGLCHCHSKHELARAFSRQREVD
jgi:hypothetical protein